MALTENINPSEGSKSPMFPETRWSLVLHVQGQEGADGHGVQLARKAMEELCQIYWYPVYAFIRRNGYDAPAAEDLTQGFFHMVLSQDLFPKADREKGRLRSFLLRAAKRFVGQQRIKAEALKRGGAKQIVSFDVDDAEERFVDESRRGLAADIAFEQRWAITLLDNALAALEEEQRAAGRGEKWEALSPFLAWNSGAGSQEDAAASLGITVGAFRASLLRLRRRYRILLADIISETIENPDDLDEEIRYLFQVLSR